MPWTIGPVALTGATGFIGSAILRAGCKRGWRMRALARRPGRLPAGVEAVPGQLADEAALGRLCAGAEVVIHCAGAVRAASAADFHATNAEATARLVQAALRAGVRRLVLISSLAARQPDISPYAASKRAGERAVEALGAAMEWAIVRPPAVYGPGDRATLPIFRQAARGFLIVPARAGLRLSLLHCADLARLVCAVAEAERPPAARVMEPDDAPGGHSWAEIAAAGAAAAGRPALRLVRVPYAAALAAGTLAGVAGLALGRPPLFSGAKAREAFHPDWTARGVGPEHGAWQPEIALEQGFRDTFAWYRERKWL